MCVMIITIIVMVVMMIIIIVIIIIIIVVIVIEIAMLRHYSIYRGIKLTEYMISRGSLMGGQSHDISGTLKLDKTGRRVQNH